MELDIISYITSILDSQNIQCIFLKEPFDNIPQMDYNLRTKLFETNAYEDVKAFLRHHCTDGALFIARDSYLLTTVVFKLPEAFKAHGDYVIIGPLLFYKVTKAEFDKVSIYHRLSVELQKQFFAFYEQIPVLGNYDRFEALLLSLLLPIMGDDFTIHHADVLGARSEASRVGKECKAWCASRGPA